MGLFTGVASTSDFDPSGDSLQERCFRADPRWNTFRFYGCTTTASRSENSRPWSSAARPSPRRTPVVNDRTCWGTVTAGPAFDQTRSAQLFIVFAAAPCPMALQANAAARSSPMPGGGTYHRGCREGIRQRLADHHRARREISVDRLARWLASQPMDHPAPERPAQMARQVVLSGSGDAAPLCGWLRCLSDVFNLAVIDALPARCPQRPPAPSLATVNSRDWNEHAAPRSMRHFHTRASMRNGPWRDKAASSSVLNVSQVVATAASTPKPRASETQSSGGLSRSSIRRAFVPMEATPTLRISAWRIA